MLPFAAEELKKDGLTVSILNQEISDEEGVYRIRVGNQVGYLTISTDVFDDFTMCRPFILIPRLPKFPSEPWTRISIKSAKQCDGAPPGGLVISATNDPLPEIEFTWHQNYVDVLSLKQTKRHRSNVHEVLYNGLPAVTKIAAFEWEVPRLERETWAYWVIDHHQHVINGIKIAPRVLGHLTEFGRVVGLLLERQEGCFASVEDLPECASALQKLHKIGLIHGDVNRYNFVVNKERKCVTMVDFEHAAAFEEEATAKTELESLAAELEENTGRGGPAKVIVIGAS